MHKIVINGLCLCGSNCLPIVFVIYTSKCHCLIRSTAAVKLKITNELI